MAGEEEKIVMEKTEGGNITFMTSDRRGQVRTIKKYIVEVTIGLKRMRVKKERQIK